jgi:predicted ester cyclase
MFMSAEENEALVRRYIEVVWNKRETGALDEFLAPHYKRYVSATATPLSSEDQRQRVTGFHVAFPDIHFTIEDVFAEGDRAAFRATLRGTHQGQFPFFQGMAPTGKQVTVSVIDLVRIEHGKFTEHWGGPDLLDLLQQLGAAISVGPERKRSPISST